MKLTSAFIWSTLITILVIVIANIIATEYRLKRERELDQMRVDNGAYCPACPPCASAAPQTT